MVMLSLITLQGLTGLNDKRHKGKDGAENSDKAVFAPRTLHTDCLDDHQCLQERESSLKNPQLWVLWKVLETGVRFMFMVLRVVKRISNCGAWRVDSFRAATS